jgi:hypothetical protein
MIRSKPTLPPEKHLTTDVAEALAEERAAREAHDAALARGAGHDWSYFGHAEIQRLDRAIDRLGQALDAYMSDFIARCQHEED